MRDLFDVFYPQIQKYEGGYVNHPSDPGGETNYGITQRAYLLHLKSLPGFPVRVKDLTPDQAKLFYRKVFWDPLSGYKFSASLRCAFLDTAINFGQTGAAQFLQAVVGTSRDGIIGPVTLGKVRERRGIDVAVSLCQERLDYRFDRVRQAPSQEVFLFGWCRRDMALAAYLATSGLDELFPPSKLVVPVSGIEVEVDE